MLRIPEGSLCKRSCTGCPIHLNFVMFIISQLRMWLERWKGLSCPRSDSEAEACGLGGEGEGPPDPSGPDPRGSTVGILPHGQRRRKRANPPTPHPNHWPRDPPIRGFSFPHKRFQAKCLAVLEYMTPCQSATKLIMSSLRSRGFGISRRGEGTLLLQRDK